MEAGDVNLKWMDTSVSASIWIGGQKPGLNVYEAHDGADGMYVVSTPGQNSITMFFSGRDELEDWIETLRCLVVDTYETDPQEGDAL